MSIAGRLAALEAKLFSNDEIETIQVNICQRGEDGNLEVINTWTINLKTQENVSGEWVKT
jgi:hypothetical protein